MVNPIKKFGYVGAGRKAFTCLKKDVLEVCLLRRTKACLTLTLTLTRTRTLFLTLTLNRTRTRSRPARRRAAAAPHGDRA